MSVSSLWLGVVAQAALSSSPTLPPTLPTRAAQWTLTGAAIEGCALESSGVLEANRTVDVAMHCTQDVSGNVTATLPATAMRQRRITLLADIKADAPMQASLWIKSLRDGKTLQSDNDFEQSLLDEGMTQDGWLQRSLTLPVSADATQVSVGLLVQGSGHAELRNVRVVISEAGEMAPAAAQWLDAALEIIHRHAGQRRDVSWLVLDAQTRVFASGAQTPHEVYPAIRYLLEQLDRQSQLLTPGFATALSALPDHAEHQSTPQSTPRFVFFKLPDGAGLALRAEGNVDTRVARVNVRVGEDGEVRSE